MCVPAAAPPAAAVSGATRTLSTIATAPSQNETTRLCTASSVAYNAMTAGIRAPRTDASNHVRWLDCTQVPLVHYVILAWLGSAASRLTFRVPPPCNPASRCEPCRGGGRKPAPMATSSAPILCVPETVISGTLSSFRAAASACGLFLARLHVDASARPAGTSLGGDRGAPAEAAGVAGRRSAGTSAHPSLGVGYLPLVDDLARDNHQVVVQTQIRTRMTRLLPASRALGTNSPPRSSQAAAPPTCWQAT